MAEGIRAFSRKDVRYFRLKEDFGPLKAGAVFYLNKEDKSMSLCGGTLVLCWTPEGNCYSGMCAGNVVLNYPSFSPDIFYGSPGESIFEETDGSIYDFVKNLKPGFEYDINVGEMQFTIKRKA